MVIDGAFDAATHGAVIVHAVTGLEANGIAQVQQQVRRWPCRVLARRGLLPADDARAMKQRDHGACFCFEGSVRVEAPDRAGRARLLRYCGGPPFALDRLRRLECELLLYERAKTGAGAPRCVFSRHRS